MPIIKLNSRTSKIDSCILSIADFKSLFTLLNKKVKEACEIEVNEPKTFENMPEDQVEVLKERIKQYYKLGVLILGTKGEMLTGDDDSVFDDENFPKNISRITFDSSYYLRAMTGRETMNKLIVQFDFKKQKVFDFSNPITTPMPNESLITVAGLNDTWVSGIYAIIINFLEDKKKKRNWLHKKHVYDLFLFILFYPISFWCIYKISSLLYGKINLILLIAICLYIFTLLVFILRILFNYTRWVLPLLEFIPKSGTKMLRHRAILTIIALGIISTLIVNIIKSLF